MRRHGVRCLLMGGQACVFYGAAEFSREVDFALLADPDLRTMDLGSHVRATSEAKNTKEALEIE
jgi:hypothetical protein